MLLKIGGISLIGLNSTLQNIQYESEGNPIDRSFLSYRPVGVKEQHTPQYLY